MQNAENQPIAPPQQTVILTRMRNFIRSRWHTTPTKISPVARIYCVGAFLEFNFDVHQMATFFGCSMRTIYRDIESVSVYSKQRVYVDLHQQILAYLYHFTYFPK